MKFKKPDYYLARQSFYNNLQIVREFLIIFKLIILLRPVLKILYKD